MQKVVSSRKQTYPDPSLCTITHAHDLKWGAWPKILHAHFYYSTFSLHEDPNSLAHAEVNHARGSYIYTMGILYRKISQHGGQNS